MAEWKVGVLIVGSLFWDPRPHRQHWRDHRLLLGEACSVTAPIRYGRKSSGRKNTFTTVFSTALSANNTGLALAVPFRTRITAPSEVVYEAELLWNAEQSRRTQQGAIAASWGAVGLLLNPRRSPTGHLAAEWRLRVESEADNFRGFPSAAGEEPALDDEGFLAIPWPRTESEVMADFDALLATATRPSPDGDNYYAPEAIASAWRDAPDERRYFDRNRACGISTFQDSEILRFLDGASI